MPANVINRKYVESRVRNWCFGLDKSDLLDLSSEMTLSDKISIGYNILTAPLAEGGCGITPNYGRWKFVTSVYAPQNEKFNKDFLERWSKKYFVSDSDLESIKSNFGAEVALYFHFLQTYLKWGLFLSAVGILTYFYGTQYSAIYAIITIAWAISFIEYWRQKQTRLAVEWGTLGISNAEGLRAEFKGSSQVKNPITGKLQPYYPTWKRALIQIGMFSLSLAAGCVLIFLQTCIYSIEIYFRQVYTGPFQPILVFIPTILLAVVVAIFTAAYKFFVSVSLRIENYANRSDYEFFYIEKVFVLDFLVSYGGLLWTAYLYLPFGNMVDNNLDKIVLHLSRYSEKSKEYTCSKFVLDDGRLADQFFYFMVTAQIINLAVETLLPIALRYVKLFVRTKILKIKFEPNDDPKEHQFLRQLRAASEKPPYTPPDDYREMVIQFGHLVMFGTIWPLAPVAVTINNWFEMRGDAVKMCIDCQKPIPRKADSIGAWLLHLEFLTWLGSIVSASLVAMYSPSDSPYYWPVHRSPKRILLVVLVAEHLYLLIRMFIRHIYGSGDLGALAHDRALYATRSSIVSESVNLDRQFPDTTSRSDVLAINRAQYKHGISLMNNISDKKNV
ncbi:hypothetical protein CANCADRAFT_20971 [Tortispora caseinolytica NRRL Y-17796]|uniref:Anoctamin dimerisation domain-containing protein n=1 Tax=Tortispora caseinolytica NRRL Y-17796 TaxID=767744 RepID=A0A1E4TJS8_9ASCO|nr:hypothetical protein CANCADRAFT_20971 [Tortispora caseinolytica NRRL Y-17796]